MLCEFNLVKVTSCCPTVVVGNVDKNVDAILEMIEQHPESDVLLFPELSLTGYTCGDLFGQQKLIDNAWWGLIRLARGVKNQVVVVGLPVEVEGALYNCAAVLNDRKILGIVPKTYLPNYKEFYEKRWFKSGKNTQSTLEREIPFGTNLLFKWYDLIIGVEICEDLWVTIPPSSYQTLAGANLILNLSASNETVGKADYRRSLVENQSGRGICAYAYSSAGPSESSSDLVFGGHCLIADNGHVVAERNMTNDEKSITAVIDVERLNHERHYNSFGDGECPKEFVNVLVYNINYKQQIESLSIDSHPFVPSNYGTLKKRCTEIFDIQSYGLIQRLQQLSPSSIVNIGISGGLDSTLALLVAIRAADKLGWSRERIRGITMPGFGTTNRTKTNAIKMMEQLGIQQKTVDIRETCVQMFKDIGHKPFGIEFEDVASLEKGLLELPPDAQDVVFENVQARARTMILMSHGFVAGTGDLSELALGWCTYNGDHMSMYNVNCSIPKTLVKFLVEYVANYQANNMDRSGKLCDILKDIILTEISPELLPVNKDGENLQSTETVLGPYELHDFFLANFIRYGFSPQKILFLANHSDFSAKYPPEIIEKWLRVFITRFFKNQFKRNCVPDGPKVGSVSLSPRGDWRMPSDADSDLWLKELK